MAVGMMLALHLAATAADWEISLRGAGPIRLGAKLATVRRILKDPAAHLEGNEPLAPLNECAYLESKSIPEHLGIMIARGRVVRIDVFAPGISTRNGASVGDTEERIKQLYPGQITVEPHHYLAESGHYLNYFPGKPKRAYGMVFETDGNIVTSFRVGTREAIALVEGCS